MKIKIYDNGVSCDRYTVVYNGSGDYIGMSENPYNPQGFGQHGEGITPGKHLGKRITFDMLPEQCRKLVLSELSDYNATI